MAESKVGTAIGQRLPKRLTDAVDGAKVQMGQPPVVMQVQTFAYIPLERPEQLKQWEEDVRNHYGLSLDASDLAGIACETCSCCSDDCGIQ